MTEPSGGRAPGWGRHFDLDPCPNLPLSLAPGPGDTTLFIDHLPFLRSEPWSRLCLSGSPAGTYTPGAATAPLTPTLIMGDLNTP